MKTPQIPAPWSRHGENLPTFDEQMKPGSNEIIARQVCPNCGQWIHAGETSDCLNECYKRGIAGPLPCDGRNPETFLYRTAPHECAPECPGEQNRAKLAVFEAMREALNEMDVNCENRQDEPFIAYVRATCRAALALADKASR